MIHVPFGFRLRKFAYILIIMIVYLVGFMGSGKSFTGKLLASEMNVPHIDLDQWIEEKYGNSISSIFANEGEEAFRQKETLALEELYQNMVTGFSKKYPDRGISLIISTGGGAPCFNGNMDWMNQHGLTVWLDPHLEVLLKRLEKEKLHRPLLAGLIKEEMEKFVVQKLKERSVFYGQANLRICDEKMDTKTLIKNIKHAQDIQ
jgi:shikimate kinase